MVMKNLTNEEMRKLSAAEIGDILKDALENKSTTLAEEQSKKFDELLSKMRETLATHEKERATNSPSSFEKKRQAPTPQLDKISPEISQKVDESKIEEYDEEMKERMAILEARFDTVLPTLATKSDIESIKTEIFKSSGETHKWMIGTVIGLFLGFGGLFLAMSNALKPAAPTTPQQPQPVIIYPQTQQAPQAVQPLKQDGK